MTQPVHENNPNKPCTTQAPPTVGYFPPLWSIALTLLLVVFCAGSLVLAVVSLGGKPAPPLPPQLVVLTAPPIQIAQESGDLQSPVASGSLALSAQMPASFAMSGPTLPPPNITPTPVSIEVGRTVRVIGVGAQQLNVRERPGVIGVDVQFRAPENTLFLILDGPSHTDGLTWWHVRDLGNNRTGWAASNYLEVVPDDQS